MAKFRLSGLAEADLLEIGSYTLQTWGTLQAVRYMDQLENVCQLLADNPTLGRPCDKIKPKLRRLEQGRHVIYYRIFEHDIGEYGILVSRILHQRMVPEHHDLD